MEYKRLDETEKSYNDSLDDISVSLNNDPIRSASRQGLRVASKDKEMPEEDQQQPLSFIDEDPSVIPEGQGNMSSLEAPPSSGLIGETGNGTSGHVAVCDECVNAGHMENGDTSAETPAVVVTAETVSDINQNIQIDKHQEEESLNIILEAAAEAIEPVAESSAKTDIRTTPVTDTGDTGENQDQDKREEDVPEEEEAGLMSAQQPLMSSKLSVASIQSGESLGSFSFSADSLGKSYLNDR